MNGTQNRVLKTNVLSHHRKSPMTNHQPYRPFFTCPHTYGVRPWSYPAIATDPCRPTACVHEWHIVPCPTANYSLLTANWTYTFSAKERDPETSLSYFGSRYYSSDLSIWLSVDPMSDKYPSLSPYTYCANNPVILVDPNGDTIGHVDEASLEKIKALTDKNSPDYSRAFTRLYHRLERSKQVYNFYEATESEITTNTQGKVQENENGSVDIIHSSVSAARTSDIGGFSQQYATLFEETFHAVDYDRGGLDLNNHTCKDEAQAWKFATKAPGTSFRCGPKNKDLSLANCFRTKSIPRLAKILHDGYTGTIVDVLGRKHQYQIHDSNDSQKGIYFNLPLK